MNSLRKGFTLVEVAIAGSLIGFCVLTALSIIPRGLVVQNEGRMRAVAAATIAYLASESFGASMTTKMTEMPSLSSSITDWRGERVGITGAPPGSIHRLDTPKDSGRLERRIIYTVTDSGTIREYTAWLLSKDPDDSPLTASYLATFGESL